LESLTAEERFLIILLFFFSFFVKIALLNAEYTISKVKEVKVCGNI